MARVVIVGCGALGSLLGERLAAAGHEVWGVRRTVAALPPVIRPVTADLRLPAELEALPEGIDYLVYTASAGGFEEASYFAAYVEGPAHVLALLARRGERPRRLLFTSSTAVYGQVGGEWVDEDSPTEPAGFSGRCLLEGEALFRDSPFPATVVRLTGLYGPGPGRLIAMLRAGAATIPSGPPQYTNRIHRIDAARLLHHLMELAAPADRYLGVDTEPTEIATLYGWLADALALPPPPVAGAGHPVRGGNKRCRNDRIVATGFTYRYPTFRDGYGAIVAALEG